MFSITKNPKVQRQSLLGGNDDEFGFRHTKFDPGNWKYREEYRRRVRVGNVDFWGIIKEWLIPGGRKKLGDEMPMENSRGQTLWLLKHMHLP